jgi:methionine-rich copper-binding protein CopC
MTSSRPAARVARLACSAAFIVVALAAAAPAHHFRHLRLEKSAPADSSVVEAAPSVSLWFSQATGLDVTRVVVRASGGDTISTLPLTRDAKPKSPIVAAFRSPLPAGSYAVDWRTMAADGHVVRGSFRFTVRPVATGP